MMVGSVFPDGQAVLLIRIRGPAGQIANVQAVVDTGFTDELLLPPWVVQKLQLQAVEKAIYSLADGTTASTYLYLSEIEWLGAWRQVLVTEVDANALIGMALMHDCLLSIEIRNAGRVTLTPLSS